MGLPALSNAHRIWRPVLLVLLLWGFGMRLHAILVLKEGLSHDESVTYLCASATEGAYQERINGLVDESLYVGNIHSFYERPRSLECRTVARDLALWDIHPPLYFWTLHAVHVFLGAGIIGGALLNLLAGLGVLTLTFLMARRALGSGTAAWAAVALWYLSPAVVPIDLEARHYQFMALLAMASFLLAERLSDGRRSIRDLALFTVVNAAGLLTHYYFSFLLLPGALIMLRHFGFRPPAMRYFGTLVLSLGIFFLSFPEILDFIRSYPGRDKDPSDALDVAHRLKTMLYASLAFFTQVHMGRYIYLVLAIGGSILGMVLVVRKGYLVRPDTTRPIVQFAFTMGWAGLFTSMLYLLGISPPHAAGEQYLAYFWPLLAIGIVHVARLLVPVRYQEWVFAAHMIQLCPAFHTATRGSEYLQNAIPLDWYAKMADADLLITDDRKRSGLPRIMHHLPAQLPLVIMDKKRPDLAGMDHVAFLHLAIDERPPILPFIDWMTGQGYVEDLEVGHHEHYELHHFRR